MNAPLEAGRFGSGKTVRRIEDPALVTGRGQFTDDVALPGSCTWSSCAALMPMRASAAWMRATRGPCPAWW